MLPAVASVAEGVAPLTMGGAPHAVNIRHVGIRRDGGGCQHRAY